LELTVNPTLLCRQREELERFRQILPSASYAQTDPKITDSLHFNDTKKTKATV